MAFRKTALVFPFLLFGLSLSGPLQVRQDSTTWPTSYIAMGDSFAAGIGAGKYFQPIDDEVTRCKRFDGSYPAQAKALMTMVTAFDFVACSGDVISGLDGQHQKLGDKRADVVTLSISGNDFKFADVVAACIYNYQNVIGGSDTKKDKDCKAALDAATSIVNSDTVWNDYTTAVNKIISDRLTDNSHSVLIITGYAQFFDTQSTVADKFVFSRFPIPGKWGPLIIQANLLHKNTRDTMNSLVAQVNSNIQSKIVNPNSGKIKFVDIDAHTNGHRFAELQMDNPVPGKTGDNDNVWFISLETALQEDKFVNSTSSEEDLVWSEWRQNLTNQASAEVSSGPGELQQTSVFHPKAAGHALTAQSIKDVVDMRGRDIACVDSNAGTIPTNPIIIPNSNTVGARQLLYMIREQLCGDPEFKCQMPANVPAEAGAVLTDAGGRCEITVGVSGVLKLGVAGNLHANDYEAYMVRDRSISGTEQVQHCWDVTQTIIESCVQVNPKEGWENGADNTPAFYQAGLVQLNSRTHPAIDENNVLKIQQ